VATIQISAKTQKRLFEVASRLQLRLKRRVSFDEAIRYLLEHGKVEGKNKHRFASFYGCARAGKAEEARKMLRELRTEEESRLEELGA
jgi:pentatricopeptide repeat protein